MLWPRALAPSKPSAQRCGGTCVAILQRVENLQLGPVRHVAPPELWVVSPSAPAHLHHFTGSKSSACAALLTCGSQGPGTPGQSWA